MPNNTKPCHNCRRRRLRCDRSWPSCHKCTVSGQECLGYGQLFVWTEGIDSSGNVKKQTPLSGRKASVGPEAPHADADADDPTIAADEHPELLYERHGPNPSSRHYDAQRQQQYRESQESPIPASAPLSHAYPSPHSHPQPHNARSVNNTTMVVGAPRVSYSRANLVALTDPLFQDLDRNSRYYLSHCECQVKKSPSPTLYNDFTLPQTYATLFHTKDYAHASLTLPTVADRVCQDLVARNASGANPFTQLIPLANKHPLLLEILVATSAMHWSNIFRPAAPIPTDLTKADGYLAQLRSRDLVSRGAFIDALAAKQRAMGHLRGVLDTLDPAGSEVVLAAMHFFIKFDLIDLEKTEGPSWRTHLEGAFSILSLLTPDAPGDHSHQMLRDCVIADCFIYHIFGSTLAASGGLAARIARYGFELLPVMKRVEMNGFLSCPREILQVILMASQLSCDPEAPCTDESLTAADEALALIDQALAFDIPAWASRLKRLDLADVESRVFVASAHRSAACLYILQALPLVRAVRPVDPDFLVSDILSNLSMVKESDWFFKASSWPIFIAGAETRDLGKRTWCLHRLLAIWETCPWGYIFTAIEMLKATWEMQDSRGSAEEEEVNWLRDLKRLGFDYLIV